MLGSVALALLAWLAAPAQAAAGEKPSPELVSRLIEEWRFPEAEAAVAELVRAHPGDPVALLLESNLLFQQGDYEGAAERLKAVEHGADHASWRELVSLVDSTREATRGFVEERSPEGHFIIRHAPGRDELLAPYALETLEAARREIGERDFEAGARLGDPVRVEIFPEVADLSKVSTLSIKEIETSGTIAVCKFNKLMIVSPRALSHGYPWLDTLAHEYTHFIVTRVSRNTAPIWLHEGLAKFEERRWRLPQGDGSGLTPMMEHLLASALASGPERPERPHGAARGGGRRLITFEEMYPSMAKLPSQEDSALAFAEVYTVVQYLHAVKGWRGVRQILENMQKGSPDAQAVADVAGVSFDSFQKAWKTWLRGRKLRLHPGMVATGLRFAHGKGKGGAGGGSPGAQDEKDDVNSDEVAEERARKFLRLGGMLRVQGRLAPAAAEYEKAQALVGPGHFIVATRLARTLLSLGSVDRAIAVAEPAFELYPESGGAASILGEAWWKKKDGARAATYFEAAIQVSPFDPAPHCALADIYAARPDPRADRERKACRTLSN